MPSNRRGLNTIYGAQTVWLTQILAELYWRSSRVVCDEDDYVALRSLLGRLPQVGTKTCNQVARLIVTNNLNYKDLFFQSPPDDVFNTRQAKALARARDVRAVLAEFAPDDTLDARGSSSMASLLEDEYDGEAASVWAFLLTVLPGDATLQEARDYLWSESDETAEAIDPGGRRASRS